MTAIQKLWTLVFNLAPATVIAIHLHWWTGALAFVATAVMSVALTFLVTPRVPLGAMTAWAWTKPPLVSAAVLCVFLIVL